VKQAVANAPGLVSYRHHTDEGYFYIVFENESHDGATFEINLLFKEGAKNMEIMYPERGCPEHKFQLSPGQSKVLIAKRLTLKEGCSIPYQFTTKPISH
jgi:hypothetical protein